MEIIKSEQEVIPLFVKSSDGDLTIIPAENFEIQVNEGSKLVYLGKLLELETSENPKNNSENKKPQS